MKLQYAIRTTLILISALLLFIFLGIWVFDSIIEKVVHNRSEVLVPDIEGMTINESLTILSEDNLSLFKVAEKYDTGVPAGSIISQSPPAGLTVREGKAIEAVISSGGKVVFVPEITAKSLRQAELLLRQSGLLIGEQIRTFSSTIDRDYVVTQDPAARQVVEQNSYINIVVSRGPAEEDKIKKMPNLLGIRMAKAEQILKEMNLDLLKLETVINDEVPEGTVLSQEPEEGSIVDVGSKVKLVISNQSRSFKEIRESIVYHEVTQSGQDKSIKIVVIDDIGERVIFEQIMPGGTKIELPVKLIGEAQAIIYADDIMVQEFMLEDQEKEIIPEPREENNEEKVAGEE